MHIFAHVIPAHKVDVKDYVMADNNIGTLFHFTRNKKTLEKILKEGFRITYCKESFGSSFLGIPMVSFCDIPLSRTDQHKKDYGIYAIGLDKDLLLANGNITYLNPVIYCHSNILANSLISYKEEYKRIQSDIEERTLKNDQHPNVMIDTRGSVGATLGMLSKSMKVKRLSNSILGFTKPYSGIVKKRNVTFYNEREWRFVIPEETIIDGVPCKWLDEGEYDKWRGDYKHPKKMFNTILPIDARYVTHLIVNQENSIPSFIDYIWKSKHLFGNPSDDEQKRMLISRITSFQRIKRDF